MRKRILGLAALLGAVGAITIPAGATAKAPVQLTFHKQALAAGVWSGTVSGDIEGALTTRLISLDDRKPVWRVTFDWIIDAGTQSFTARLDGTLDTTTGAVAMKGRVVEGYLLGAHVREQGQLIDPATSGFEGTIEVRPQGHAR